MARIFKLKLCTCAHSHALGTCTRFQFEILIRITISAIPKFEENIRDSSWKISETTPWVLTTMVMIKFALTVQWPGTHFTNGLWAHEWNLVKIIFVLIFDSIIQSSNNFAYVMTAKLWPVWVIILHVKSIHISMRFGSSAHKAFVKWMYRID